MGKVLFLSHCLFGYHHHEAGWGHPTKVLARADSSRCYFPGTCQGANTGAPSRGLESRLVWSWVRILENAGFRRQGEIITVQSSTLNLGDFSRLQCSSSHPPGCFSQLDSEPQNNTSALEHNQVFIFTTSYCSTKLLSCKCPTQTRTKGLSNLSLEIFFF